MKCRLLAFAFLSLCFASPSQAVFFAGELTTSDAIAEDIGWGNFYYDLYYFAVDVPMTIEVFMTPTDPFAPWLGYWEGDFSATPDYDTPPPLDSRFSLDVSAQLYMAIDALPGIEYQLVAATYDYNPTNLGAYNFFVVDFDRTDLGFSASTSPIMNPQSVPAPASWLMLGLGLFVLLLANKLGATMRVTLPIPVRC